MVQIYGNYGGKVDFSFLPSLKCNLHCSFCQYDAGFDNEDVIDLSLLSLFINSIPINIIHSFGLYGGEPSINIPLYGQVINLLPNDIPKFLITNGTWSTSNINTNNFLDFAKKYKIQVFVSTTPEHTVFQNNLLLNTLVNKYSWLCFKTDDSTHLITMGRYAQGKQFKCSNKCLSCLPITRLAVMPTGEIIFQSCDGSYPVVGNVKDIFDFQKYKNNVKQCSRLLN